FSRANHRKLQMMRCYSHVIRIALGVVFCVIAGRLPAQPTNRAIVLDDLAKLRTIGDPQASPDGRWVAYTVETVDVEKDKRDTDVWMASWDGREQLRLTSTPETSERMPRWSPDNRSLAFLTSRGDEAHRKQGAQVWLLN